MYRVSADLAIIQTVDFFTPVVNDPYGFGQIAAANALSDVYAMGGIPKTAMNLVGFPVSTMDISILKQVIQGGIDKVREAGAVILGGHSVEDMELKYGLSVTGYIHPDKILTKQNIRAGDTLLLTKPLGTGIVNTAIKAKLASGEITRFVTRVMAELNQTAASVMVDFPVHACTDITGFGLIGHLAEMVEGTGLGIEIQSGDLPVIDVALGFAATGLIPGGAYKNRQFREAMVDMGPSVDRSLQDILYDPQTSGGLLISVAPGAAKSLLDRLHDEGVEHSAIIGRVTDHPEERITVR